MPAIPSYALNLATGKLVTLTTPDLSDAFVDKATDTLYVAVGTDAHALFQDEVRATGTWVKLVVLPRYESFKWLHVESTFEDADGEPAAVTVEVTTADGTVLSTSVVTSLEPVILAPFREREIVVIVTSAARVTGITFASSSEELQQV